jgi:hypothetical protein
MLSSAVERERETRLDWIEARIEIPVKSIEKVREQRSETYLPVVSPDILGPT